MDILGPADDFLWLFDITSFDMNSEEHPTVYDESAKLIHRCLAKYMAKWQSVHLKKLMQSFLALAIEY